MPGRWIKTDELPKTMISTSGGRYSHEFAKKHGIYDYHWSWDQEMVWIPEPVEINVDGEGVIWCRRNSDLKKYQQKEKFETSKGLFVSHNLGEFGGWLMTPGEVVSGNFREVIEAYGRVYAIDSLSHGSVRRTKIYEFAEDYTPILRYSNHLGGPMWDLMAYKRYCRAEDAAYILISGFSINMKNYETIKEESLVYRLDPKGISLFSRLGVNLDYVYSMAVREGQMILGMDKIAAVIDLTTGEIKNAVSLIDPDAEAEILRMQNRKEV